MARRAFVIFGVNSLHRAKAMAEKAGRFVWSTMDELRHSFQRNFVFESEPQTAIIEGFRIGSDEDAAFLKALISEDETVIEEPGKPLRKVRTPNFIFVTQSPDFIPAPYGERRYMIINAEEERDEDSLW